MVSNLTKKIIASGLMPGVNQAPASYSGCASSQSTFTSNISSFEIDYSIESIISIKRFGQNFRLYWIFDTKVIRWLQKRLLRSKLKELYSFWIFWILFQHGF